MAKIDSLSDLSPRVLGELKAWLEPWFLSHKGAVTTVTSGGTSRKKILFTWAGPLPAAPVTSIVWRVPYDTDGSTFTFTLARAFARIESTQGSSVQIIVQRSPGGGAFTATTVTTVTIGVGAYEQENTGLSFSVSSGDLLQLSFAAVPGPQPYFQVEVEGTQ